MVEAVVAELLHLEEMVLLPLEELEVQEELQVLMEHQQVEVVVAEVVYIALEPILELKE